MIKIIKQFIFGSPIRGEKLQILTNHQTIMPISCSMEEWKQDKWIKTVKITNYGY